MNMNMNKNYPVAFRRPLMTKRTVKYAAMIVPGVEILYYHLQQKALKIEQNKMPPNK